MSAEQREQPEDQEPAAQQVDYDADEIDRDVYNRDTTRFVWRSLMEEGIREATASHVGKTIVFARNHIHAVHLAPLFCNLFPLKSCQAMQS